MLVIEFNLESVIEYIENRRNSDGGYNSVGIAPSSAADTFFAVATYNLLGLFPPHPDRIIEFITSAERARIITSLKGVYVFTKTLKLLGYENDLGYQTEKILSFKNDRGGFGIGEDLYIEITDHPDRSASVRAGCYLLLVS